MPQQRNFLLESQVKVWVEAFTACVRQNVPVPDSAEAANRAVQIFRKQFIIVNDIAEDDS